jgi:hypothetical protein
MGDTAMHGMAHMPAITAPDITGLPITGSDTTDLAIACNMLRRVVRTVVAERPPLHISGVNQV